MNNQLPKKFLNERETSTVYSVSVSWLQKARMRRTGPAYVKRGKSVLYAVADLDAYFNNRRIVPEGDTSQSPKSNRDV